MSELYREKHWLTLSQLVKDWAGELGVSPGDLDHEIAEDIVNGKLDDFGGETEGRSGLRLIVESAGSVGKAGMVKGAELARLLRMPPGSPLRESHIIVLREAVLAFASRRHLTPPSWWPSDGEVKPEAASDRTGAAGAPSSMQLVENEMRRRALAGELAPTLAQEADALRGWLTREHPGLRRATAKTIKNCLGVTFGHLKFSVPE
jgi:hypothetical protein